MQANNSRRPHTKSRSGCNRCRERRVKCDELRPICYNCQHRDEECQYNRPQQTYQVHTFALIQRSWSANGAVATASSPGEVHGRTNAPTTCLDRMRASPLPSDATELRLLNVWYTQTCYSFTTANASFLRERVGKQALNCDFLMGALLGSTALHLASETHSTVTARNLITISLQHQNRALVGLQQSLYALIFDNCDDIFLTTALMMMCSFVSSITLGPTGTQHRSTTDAMIEAFRILERGSSCRRV